MAQVAGREPGLVPASIVPPWPAESMVHLAAISLGTASAAWLCAKGSGVHGDLEKRVRVTKHESAFLRSQPLARGDPLTFPERAETGPNRVWLQGPHLGRKKSIQNSHSSMSMCQTLLHIRIHSSRQVSQTLTTFLTSYRALEMGIRILSVNTAMWH